MFMGSTKNVTPRNKRPMATKDMIKIVTLQWHDQVAGFVCLLLYLFLERLEERCLCALHLSESR